MNEEHLLYFNYEIFAKSAVQTLCSIAKEEDGFRKLLHAKQILLAKYPENAVVANTIDFFLEGLTSNIKKEAGHKRDEALKSIHQKMNSSAKTAAKKIQPGSRVFFHSADLQLLSAAIEAKKYKELEVNLLEHAPERFGQEAKEKLEAKGIKASIFPDLHLAEAIENSDVVMIGADAITKNSIISKKGTSLVLEMAKKNHRPAYALGHAWRYHKNIGLKERHPVLEETPMAEFSGIIIETGIFRPEHVMEEIHLIKKIAQ